ncbi:hypothetical protein OKW21_004938 [Catalinimonas alkaloidigena]|nr:hypothetical protein [Catalinimonas alkaloidigena]
MSSYEEVTFITKTLPLYYFLMLRKLIARYKTSF